MVGQGIKRRNRLFAILSFMLLCTVAWAPEAIAALPWSQEPPLPAGTSRAAGAVIDGKLYVLGGSTANGPSAAVYFYDPDMPTPGTGSWGTFLPPLSEPRFASAEATDGPRIYLAGGGGAPGSEASILAYDTVGGTTYPVGLLAVPRFRASAAFLNGKMYIVGGSGSGGVLDTIEEFDPSSATSTIRAQLFEPRELSATVALNGRIYIIGGADANGAPRGNCWEYDPSTNTIVPKSPLPVPLAGRAAVAANGRIFVLGGITSTGFPPTSWTDEIYVYEPGSDTWSNLGPYPTSRYYPVAGVIDGTLYIAGGDNNSPVYAERDLAVMESTPLQEASGPPAWMTMAPLPIGMSRGSSVTTLDQLFVLGGISPYNPATGTSTTLDAVQKYDPNSNSWQMLAPLPSGIFGAAGAAAGEVVYLAGGFDSQMNFLDSVLAYDLATGETRQVATLLEPRARVNGAIVGNKMYVVGGSGIGRSLSSIEEIDLSTGISTLKSFLPSPLSVAGVESVGGKIYIFGGYDDTAGAPTAASWEYDPATGMLNPLAPMPAPAEVRSALAHGGKIYVVESFSWTGYNRIQIFDILSNTWQLLTHVPTPRDVPVAGIVNGTLHVIGGATTPNLNEALPLAASAAWTIHSLYPNDPSYIDWSAPQHEPLSMRSYVQVGGTYYWVADSWPGSWNGPDYNSARLQACDQLTGMPFVTYADLRGSEGLPITFHATWPLPVPEDTTPPVTTPIFDGQPGNSGWYRSDVQVTLSAVDDLSGVSVTYYTFDKNDLLIYRSPFTLGEGVSTFYFSSLDYANNNELIQDGPNTTWKSATVSIDKTPPSILPTLSGTPGLNGWYVSPVTVSLSASDNLSGLGAISYSLDGTHATTYSVPVVIDIQGMSRFHCQATDIAGLGNLQYVDLRIDTTAPSASAFLDGAAGTNGWYVSNVTVTLTATDGESGVSRIEYSFDGRTWLTYAAPIPVSAEGIATIFYRAVDFAGNAGSASSTPVMIDKEGNAGWSSINAGIEGANAEYVALSPDFAADQTVFSVVSGVIFKSTNGGRSWVRSQNGIRFPIVKLLAISPDFASDRTLFATTSSGGDIYKSTDGGSSWAPVTGGALGPDDIAAIAVSPEYATDRTILVAANTPFGVYTDGHVYRSSDGGVTWSSSYDWPFDVHAVDFSPAFGVDRTIFSGLQGKFLKSVNGGTSWTQYANQNQNFVSFAVSPQFAEDRTIFAGSQGGGIFRSTDGGATWAPVNTGIPRDPSGYHFPVRTVVVSPDFRNDRTVIAGTAGGGVFLSSNGGSTWTPFSEALGAMDIRTLALSPGYLQDGIVFAATNNGMWKSGEALHPATDITAPETGALLNHASLDVRGTATDGTGSGVAAVEVSIDNGASWSISNGTTQWNLTLTLPGEGVYNLVSRARDNAGNTGPFSAPVEVTVDTTPPAISALLAGVGGLGGWYTSDVIVTLDAGDALSCISRIEYGFDGSTWLPYSEPITFNAEGITNLFYRATDCAGNVSTATFSEVKIDKTMPFSSFTVSGPTGENGFYTGNVVISLSAGDERSGIGMQYCSRDGGASWTPYSGPVTLAGEGANQLLCYAVDGAGNEETPLRELNVTIDRNAPVPVATDPADYSIDVPFDKLVTVTFSENVASGTAFGAITLKKGKFPVPATASLSGSVLTITPAKPLAKHGTYTLIIPAGAVKDMAGHPLAAPLSFSFSTARR